MSWPTGTAVDLSGRTRRKWTAVSIMRMLYTLSLLCAVLAVGVHALSYEISDVRLSVSSFDGDARLKQSYASASEMSNEPQTLTMEADDVIKLTFYASLSSGEKATGDALPDQAWIVMDDIAEPGAQRTSIWPLRVRGSSSSVSWSMRIDRMNEALKNKVVEAGPDRSFRLFVMLASFAHGEDRETIEPLMLPFLDVQFSEALLNRFATGKSVSKRHEAERAEGFFELPLHKHTFKTEPWQTMPSKGVSLAAALVVLVLPWTLLLGLVRFRFTDLFQWRPLFPKSCSTTRSSTVLLVCVWAAEVLAFLHWISIPAWAVFPAAGAVVVTALVGGRAALSQVWVHSD